MLEVILALYLSLTSYKPTLTYIAPVAKLDPNNGGSKTYIPKNFYRTEGSKTYIPKNFYTKTTYITLLSEKFGGSGAPPCPFYTSPLYSAIVVAYRPLMGLC
ncbi:hypothetical protein HanRHA438_Chr06g0252861 [Helianthus annuus]|uniref:Uncharacterized protein n=1 Tax=Helianthus annuus TaxID=4232 RepID=A0A9K3IQQ4_HELAN|nr:hypothetical protein HanXRQr2_Chr06g0243771 [Helianthus annuus]KAJ0910490.1 hypothetical protein HanRHA438_Chr06g0252861 [Helianthus annuus]